MHNLIEPRTVIENTCCPVCGTGISARSPRIELHPEDKSRGLVVVVRVDTAACGTIARNAPDKHVFAASINQVAH